MKLTAPIIFGITFVALMAAVLPPTPIAPAVCAEKTYFIHQQKLMCVSTTNQPLVVRSLP